MSLDDDKRATVVRLQIEDAYGTLQDAMLLAGHKRWSGAANRLYYAAFYAVSALLVHDGHPVKSHKGAGVQFNKYYIDTGILPIDSGKLYADLEDLREEGDYNCFYRISEAELTALLPRTKEMIDTIAAMVKWKPTSINENQ